MKLVIAEKPTVGKDIAMVLGACNYHKGYCEGNNFICTWAFGHLLTLFDCADYKKEWKNWKNLPVIPEEFKIKISPDSGIKEQLNIIKMLMNRSDVDSIVCATDAGREGELIFRHIYNYLNCRKPIQRLWINSLLKEDIKKGFENLEDGNSDKYKNLYNCAFAREKADWLVGMNLTRCFSNLYCKFGDKPLSIGRVQTPTLNLIVEREKEINSFKKNYYYKVQIQYDECIAEIEEKFEDESEAKLIAKNIHGTSSMITALEIESKRKKAPLLFDITSLQKECNKKYGLSAKQTLDIAQSLYEKKLITYPRTDSKFLNASMKQNVADLIEKICQKQNYDIDANVLNVINDDKVTDHHAIIPTENIFGKVSINELEKQVIDLIVLRLVVATAPAMIYEHITLSIQAKNYAFKASSNRTVNPGWTKIDGTSSIEKDNKNINLFKYKENDIWNPVSSNVNRIETKPKQRYTEDTILTAMENAGMKDFKNIDGVERVGLGTGATRAAIIEVLIQRGYVERRKKALVPTERGIHLINVVPDMIKDVNMTVKWEEKIADIKKGRLSANIFVREIENYVCDIIKDNYTVKIENNPIETGNICPRCGGKMILKKSKYGEFEACSNYPKCKYIKKNLKQAKGVCPKCGGNLIERKGKFGLFLGCSNYPKCKYIQKRKTEN